MGQMERKPIEFRQLCAMVRSIVQQEPTMSYTEWKELSLRRLIDWGFEIPDMQVLNRAMERVDEAITRTLGPRPVVIQTAAAPAKRAPEPWFGSRTKRPAGWAIVRNIAVGMQILENSAHSPEQQAAQEYFPVTEAKALDEFWNEVRWPSANRLALLRAFAEIEILRDAAWEPRSIREEYERLKPPMAGEICFACSSDRPGRSWHHVIQIQHGGSNYARNRVPICRPCHTTVHPWMDREQRQPDSWGSISEMAAGRREIGG